ncbi:MAG: hypothetical protein LC137_06710 [Burkholderiales bacterium]|nr:hypothetical protein [Burkholderiales bacterium]
MRYPLTVSRGVGLALGAVSAAGLGCVLAWLAQQPASVARVGVGMALWFACAALAYRAWRGHRAAGGGALAWDGGQWWRVAPVEGEVAVAVPEICMDLQSRLLVTVRGQRGGAEWLWLSRRAEPGRWMDLRRALVATAATRVDR